MLIFCCKSESSEMEYVVNKMGTKLKINWPVKTVLFFSQTKEIRISIKLYNLPPRIKKMLYAIFMYTQFSIQVRMIYSRNMFLFPILEMGIRNIFYICIARQTHLSNQKQKRVPNETIWFVAVFVCWVREHVYLSHIKHIFIYVLTPFTFGVLQKCIETQCLYAHSTPFTLCITIFNIHI